MKISREKLISVPSSPLQLGNKKLAERREIGRRLAAARKACGLTQKSLAESIGAKTRTVKGWEAGKSIPSGEFSAALSRGGINIAWLMKNEGTMFSHQEALAAHSNAAASLYEDAAAAARRSARSADEENYLSRMHFVIDEAAARCGFPVPRMVREALVLALMNGMRERAVEPMLQMLRAQSILDSRPPDQPADPLR